MKSCPEGIILTFRGRYLHGTCPLPGCTFPESFGSRTLPVWAAARSTTFSKGSRGGTWHVPRGTWCHVTNAIVVPAVWCIFWCLLRPDRPSRSGAIKESPWTDRQTDRLTYKQHWANAHFDPTRNKSSFLRMDYVHSSSLRFWTRGHMFRAISFEIIKFCLVIHFELSCL